jgi:hypothetical protein
VHLLLRMRNYQLVIQTRQLRFTVSGDFQNLFSGADSFAAALQGAAVIRTSSNYQHCQ